MNWSWNASGRYIATVFGVERPGPGSTRMPEITRRYSALFARHFDDVVIE